MPPPDDLLDEAAACIAGLKLDRFSADDTEIRAGERATLHWSVDTTGCANPVFARIFLNNTQVPPSGSRTVRPSRTISYGLSARAVGIVRPFGRVRIEVDDSTCEPRELPESVVAPLIQSGVRASINDYNNDPATDNKVTLRRDPVAQIEPDGVVIRLRMKLHINNFFDPDVDVDARIGVGVSAENEALAFYRSFRVDVDWPWWVTGITLGISKIVEEFVDGMVERRIKTRILNDLRAEIDSFIGASGGVVSELETQQDRVIATVCS